MVRSCLLVVVSSSQGACVVLGKFCRLHSAYNRITTALCSGQAVLEKHMTITQRR